MANKKVISKNAASRTSVALTGKSTTTKSKTAAGSVLSQRASQVKFSVKTGRVSHMSASKAVRSVMQKKR